jgi:hypothetical protein
MKELEERHAQAERRVREAAERCRAADGVERERRREELRSEINVQFDVRTQLRQSELERISRDLERLQRAVGEIRADLERREKERDAIIERRIQHLLERGDDDRD